MASYPTFEELISRENQSRLLEVRRTPRSMVSLIVLLIASVLIIFGATEYLAHQPQLAWIFSFINPRYLSLAPLILLLEILRRYHNDLYIFSAQRLTHLRGRYSLGYNIPVVKYTDIRAINVMQDFWGRVLNYGDIAIGTSAHLGNEIIISGVSDPEKLAYLIDSLRTYSRKNI